MYNYYDNEDAGDLAAMAAADYSEAVSEAELRI